MAQKIGLIHAKPHQMALTSFQFETPMSMERQKIFDGHSDFSRSSLAHADVSFPVMTVNSRHFFGGLKINRIHQVISDRPSTQTKCSACGKTATIPFKPTADKLVYYREYLAKHRTSRMGSGNRAETRRSSPDIEKQAWSRRPQDWK